MSPAACTWLLAAAPTLAGVTEIVPAETFTPAPTITPPLVVVVAAGRL
jgi:acyl CoA:acetate/3-ketoacid CoA transferase alpha subunit